MLSGPVLDGDRLYQASCALMGANADPASPFSAYAALTQRGRSDRELEFVLHDWCERRGDDDAETMEAAASEALDALCSGAAAKAVRDQAAIDVACADTAWPTWTLETRDRVTRAEWAIDVTIRALQAAAEALGRRAVGKVVRELLTLDPEAVVLSAASNLRDEALSKRKRSDADRAVAFRASLVCEAARVVQHGGNWTDAHLAPVVRGAARDLSILHGLVADPANPRPRQLSWWGKKRVAIPNDPIEAAETALTRFETYDDGAALVADLQAVYVLLEKNRRDPRLAPMWTEVWGYARDLARRANFAPVRATGLLRRGAATADAAFVEAIDKLVSGQTDWREGATVVRVYDGDDAVYDWLVPTGMLEVHHAWRAGAVPWSCMPEPRPPAAEFQGELGPVTDRRCDGRILLAGHRTKLLSMIGVEDIPQEVWPRPESTDPHELVEDRKWEVLAGLRYLVVNDGRGRGEASSLDVGDVPVDVLDAISEKHRARKLRLREPSAEMLAHVASTWWHVRDVSVVRRAGLAEVLAHLGDLAGPEGPSHPVRIEVATLGREDLPALVEPFRAHVAIADVADTDLLDALLAQRCGGRVTVGELTDHSLALASGEQLTVRGIRALERAEQRRVTPDQRLWFVRSGVGDRGRITRALTRLSPPVALWMGSSPDTPCLDDGTLQIFLPDDRRDLFAAIPHVDTVVLKHLPLHKNVPSPGGPWTRPTRLVIDRCRLLPSDAPAVRRFAASFVHVAAVELHDNELTAEHMDHHEEPSTPVPERASPCFGDSLAGSALPGVYGPWLDRLTVYLRALVAIAPEGWGDVSAVLSELDAAAGADFPTRLRRTSAALDRLYAAAESHPHRGALTHLVGSACEGVGNLVEIWDILYVLDDDSAYYRRKELGEEWGLVLPDTLVELAAAVDTWKGARPTSDHHDAEWARTEAEMRRA
jgi:hypothetical protein